MTNPVFDTDPTADSPMPDAAPVIDPADAAPTVDSVEQSPAATESADLTTAIESRAAAGDTAYADFDPALHVTRDGVPVINKDGSYRMRPGRKPKSTGAEMAPERVAPAAPTAPTPQNPTSAGTLTDNKAVALVLVSTVTALAEKTIGPEWAAEKDEVKNLTDATRKYLDSIGGVEITPGAALVIAVSGYVLPRLAVENTRSKLSRMGDWARARYYWLRGKFGANRSV